MKSVTRTRGFTLIETVIVITLAAAALTVALMYISSLSKTQQREQLIEKMAQEVAMIQRAMTEHMTGPVLTAVANRTRTQVTIPELITANRLPAAFADRDGAVGTSPFGQPYRIHVFRITDTLATGENPLTWVITEANGPLASRLARIGSDDTEDSVLGIKQAVAGALAKQHRLISGVIRSTTTTVTGDFNGFTKDIAYLLPAGPTAAQRAWVAVLHGFADLSPGGDGGGNGPPEGFTGDCAIVEARMGCRRNGSFSQCTHPDATWTKPQCDTAQGWVELTEIPVCTGGLSFRATPVGPLSYATVRTDRGPPPLCAAACAESFPCNANSATELGSIDWFSHTNYQDMRINDQSIAQAVCATDRPYNGGRDGNNVLICGYGIAQVPWANPTILNSNPKHILCCKPE